MGYREIDYAVLIQIQHEIGVTENYYQIMPAQWITQTVLILSVCPQ